MKRRSRIIIVSAVLLVIIALIVVYTVFDPAAGHFPRCPFNVLTGLKCPGCGSQRAIHALLHGDIAAAARYNLFILPALAALPAFFAVEYCPQRVPRLTRTLRTATACYIVFAIIMLWWILRNIIDI